jgi:hypothetical protein
VGFKVAGEIVLGFERQQESGSGRKKERRKKLVGFLILNFFLLYCRCRFLTAAINYGDFSL